MAFVGDAADYAERYGSIATDSGFDPSRMSADALYQTLERLAREEEASGA